MKGGKRFFLDVSLEEKKSLRSFPKLLSVKTKTFPFENYQKRLE